MSVHQPIPGARFVDPVVLSRIGNLEMVAKTVVDGLINGTHRSPFFGASVDFAEHRGYVAGDDIRRVDWRVYARTDKYYIKEFEADSNSNFSVLLDVSKSMSFGERLSKLDYAKTLAACLTYLANQQRDRVGLVTFDEGIVEHVPPSAKHLDVVLHTLDRAKAERPGHLVAPLKRLAEHFGRRGIIVVISDFYAEPDEIFDAVGLLRFRGNDVVLFHVLDPQEVDFSFVEPSSFEDLESGDQIPVVPAALADQYRSLVAAHIEALTTRSSHKQIYYMLLNNS
ncbi:MAG: DUF58 domain-containing protein, partial [Acidobacteriota bacterium]|nr:DUF58 domain-containing protein [Acidobacteriota bacterium]